MLEKYASKHLTRQHVLEKIFFKNSCQGGACKIFPLKNQRPGEPWKKY